MVKRTRAAQILRNHLGREVGFCGGWPKKTAILGPTKLANGVGHNLKKKEFLEGLNKKEKANRFRWLTNSFCWLTLWKSYDVYPFFDDLFLSFAFFFTIWPG